MSKLTIGRLGFTGTHVISHRGQTIKVRTDAPAWKKLAAETWLRTDCLDLWDREFLTGLIRQEIATPRQLDELNELVLWVREHDLWAAAKEEAEHGPGGRR